MSRFLAACVMGLLGAGEAGSADLEVRVIADIAYLAAGRTERLDLYLPVLDPDARPVPAVVMIHGGGWTGGDKAQAREQMGGSAGGRLALMVAYTEGMKDLEFIRKHVGAGYARP